MRWGGDSLPHDSLSTDYGAMALTTARIRKDFFVESAVLIIAESLTRWVGPTAHWDSTRIVAAEWIYVDDAHGIMWQF
jgi:hypothetical protein